MKSLKEIISLIIILLSVFLIFAFRTVPSCSLWNGYSVFYVSSEQSDEVIDEVFLQNEISNYVSLSNQKIPIMLEKNSVEYSMLKTNFQEFSKYISLRENYFFDKTKEFKLCYVPSEYKKNLEDCVTEFRKNGISCGIDAAAKYPWILPVILLLLSFTFVFYAKNKILYAICAIFPNLFLFCNPFYSCAVASCTLLLCLFFVTNLWQRKGFLDRILHSYKVLILLVLSIVSSFSASILSGIFCLLTLMSVCGICILYDFVDSKISSRYSFLPVYILPAKSVSIYAGKFKTIMPIILCASFLIILSFLFSSNGKSISSSSKIVLPGNSSAKSDDLPSLEDFYVWNWKVLTYPVKNLNINIDSSDKVIFPRFVQEENKLKQINEVMYFNQSFVDDVYKNIDLLDFESIEKVIKNQGEKFIPGYNTNSSYPVSLFSAIMMFICFFILLFIYFSAMIRKGGRK